MENEPSIQPGTYRSRAKSARLATTQAKGTDFIAVTFPIGDEGGTLEWAGWLTENAMEFTIAALKRCGWHGDDIRQTMRDGLDANEVDLVVEWEEYKGEVRAKIAFINAPGLSDEKALALAARVRRFMGKQEPTTAPNADEDEIPF